MAGELVVRAAVPADAGDIASIHVEAWRVAYAQILEPEFVQRLSVEDRRTMWAGLLEAVPPRHHTHVAVAPGYGEVPDALGYGGASRAARGLGGVPRDARRFGGVPRDAGGIVGFCSGGPTRDADVPGLGEIYAVYVDPPYWGRGAGTALMEAAALALLDDGYAEAVLWVLEANGQARAFYERSGWVADGANKPYQAGRMAIRYRSRLRGYNR